MPLSQNVLYPLNELSRIHDLVQHQPEGRLIDPCGRHFRWNSPHFYKASIERQHGAVVIHNENAVDGDLLLGRQEEVAEAEFLFGPLQGRNVVKDHQDRRLAGVLDDLGRQTSR